MHKTSYVSSGFTLVELLVVMAIVGVLAVGLVVAINPLEMMARARDTTRKQTLGQLQRAIESYRIANGNYPSTPSGWCGYTGSAWSCGTDWIPGLVAAKEVKTLPIDPRHAQTGGPTCVSFSWPANYTSYIYYSNGSDYKLVAHCGVEAKSDMDSCTAAKFTAGTQDPMCDPARYDLNGTYPSYGWAVWSSNVSKGW